MSGAKCRVSFFLNLFLNFSLELDKYDLCLYIHLYITELVVHYHYTVEATRGRITKFKQLCFDI